VLAIFARADERADAMAICHVCDATAAEGHVWDCPIGLGMGVAI
jgi:hypothetical protein